MILTDVSSRSRHGFFIAAIVLAFITAACSSPLQVELSPPQSTPSVKATLLPTATLTPTATPTAPAIVVRDDRPRIPQSPNPLGLAARCGVADFFDYPLDPPDAESVTGGQDFGNFRDRYEGFHTGEDWWYERRASLGKPIYAIGDGRLRYAAPYGWGDDLGTLVIEHILPNGRRLFSFYGHVDPDSLTLRVGQCVQRGEQIGEIGDPRSSPHLHFEIRTIFADGPGPGYWSIDPAKSGWLSPSQTIEFSRYTADERVSWWRAMDSSRLSSLGWVDENVLMNQEDSDIVAVDALTGEQLLRQPIEGLGVHGAWDPGKERIYLADRSGKISAHVLEETGRVNEPYTLWEEALWSATFGGSGSIQVIALEDGVVVIRRDLWSAFNASGRHLWEVEPNSTLTDWIEIEGSVLAVTSGERADLWTLTEDGAQAWRLNRSGVLFAIDNQAFLYSDEQLLQLSPATLVISPIFTWSEAQLSRAALLGLDGGGFILLHRDVFDQRLLQIGNDGDVVWEKSIQQLNADRAQLVRCGGENLMLAEQDRQSSVKVDLFRLDPIGNAEHIFQTIVRERFVSESEVTCVGDTGLLLSLGGQRMIRIDLLTEAGRLTAEE